MKLDSSQRRAVFKANLRDREILDGEILVIPLAHQAHHVVALAEFLISLAATPTRLGKAQNVHRRIEHVNADVDERAAAVLLLRDEQAPARNAATAQRLSARVIHFAELAASANRLSACTSGVKR